MADHRAEDIVTTIVTQLTGLATTGTNVFRDRAYELSEAELPAVLVYMLADNPRQPSTMAAPGLIDSDLRLVVEAVVKDSAAQVDTTLNQIRYEVGQALHADVTQGLAYVMHTTEGSAIPELQPDVDQMVGRLRMNWSVLYRRARGQAVPVFSAAQIVVDGDEIQITFTESLTSGSATAGFSWSAGAIESGSYTGNVLTLVIPPAITGTPGGTLTYDAGTGSLAGAGGAVGSFSGAAVTNSSMFAGTWSQLGSTASFPGGTTTVTKFGADSLNSNDIVVIDDVSDAVRVSRYAAGTWAGVGSTYPIASLTAPGVCALDATTVAVFKSNATAGLFALTWNGSTFSPVGSQLNIAGANQGIALCRLSSTRLLLVDSQADYMQAYDWNGSTFATAGSSFSLGGINGAVRADALTSTLVVVTDQTSNAISLYSFNGTTWSAVAGSTLYADTVLAQVIGYPCVCALNSTDIVIGGEDGKIQAMRWSGSAWATVGSSFTVSGASAHGTSALVSLGNNEAAYMRASTTNSFLRRLAWQ